MFTYFGFVKSVCSLEQKVENIRTQKKEYIELQREFAAYDLYMQCMHSNGIAYDIIKKKIPVINEEIAKVLGTSAGTVASRLNRGHLKLADLLRRFKDWLD